MKVHKNDRNVWLKGNQMEGYFPGLVKKFTSKKPTGSDNETILNPVGDELVKGYVSIYSTAGDVAKIIQRASKAIVKMYMFIDTELENKLFTDNMHRRKNKFFGVGHDNVHLNKSGVARLARHLKYATHRCCTFT